MWSLLNKINIKKQIHRVFQVNWTVCPNEAFVKDFTMIAPSYIAVLLLHVQVYLLKGPRWFSVFRFLPWLSSECVSPIITVLQTNLHFCLCLILKRFFPALCTGNVHVWPLCVHVESLWKRVSLPDSFSMCGVKSNGEKAGQSSFGFCWRPT